jgi:malonate-semialdehyde dehydrogenase (acetylating)/methylmalonate-semialdehyde dehydrogenase
MNQTTFGNRDDLINAVKSHYHNQGVYLALDRHCNSKKLILKCYFGGSYRNKNTLTEETRQRETGSRLSNCPFKIVARYSKRQQQWTIDNANEEHNHDIAGNRSGIATARRLTEEEKEITRRMVRTGSSATATLDYLTETTGNLWSTRREISL